MPKAALPILEKVLAKVRKYLDAAPLKVKTACSEFMDFDGSIGGQVLDSSPEVEHSYEELSALYQSLFKKAKGAGLRLRQVRTEFKRSGKGGWQHETRWISADEYKAFAKAVAPLVEEVRVALRTHGGRLAKDWDCAWFESEGATQRARLLVLHGDDGRIDRKPPAELTAIAKRIGEVAKRQGLSFTGGEWRVARAMEDAEGEIDGGMGVIGPA